MPPCGSSREAATTGARVGDIAEEAGVAHGLLYHYFDSKEQVLADRVPRELRRAARPLPGGRGRPTSPPARSSPGIAKILLRTWRNDPDLVTVMVREVARSPQLQPQVDEVREAFAIVERVIVQGQAEGAFRARRRRPARELDRLRRPRGGADRLGARAAPGRGRGRRPRRADGDRARPRRPRAPRLLRCRRSST